MNDQILKQLAALLNDNMGNRITVALGTGIVSGLAESIRQLEAAKPMPDDGPLPAKDASQ